jgi:O-antigen/teichoic acid export membrane protein
MAVDDFHGFFYTQFAGLVCLCAGVWLLTPHFGLAGVAWSFFISRALVFVLIQALLGAHHGLRMTRRSAAVVAYSLACLAGAAVLAGALSREGLSSILVRIGAFGVVGGATAVFLTKDERMWLAATSRRVLASSRGWVGRGTA